MNRITNPTIELYDSELHSASEFKIAPNEHPKLMFDQALLRLQNPAFKDWKTVVLTGLKQKAKDLRRDVHGYYQISSESTEIGLLARLEWLAVSLPFRKQGYGADLLAHACEFSIKLYPNCVGFSLKALNTTAEAFFKHHKFERPLFKNYLFLRRGTSELLP